MIESNVTIHLVAGRLCIFINGENITAKHEADTLFYIEEAVGLVEFDSRREYQEALSLTDAVLHEIQYYNGDDRNLYSGDDFRVHFHNLQRKIIECIPIFKWMQENQNQVGKLCDGDIESIEMGDY